MMVIRLGYDPRFEIYARVPVVALLSVHPPREKDLLEPDLLQLDPGVPISQYLSSFGNRCTRFVASTGGIRLSNSFLIEDSGEPDARNPSACELSVEQPAPDVLRYLLASRYCETDLMYELAAASSVALPQGGVGSKAIVAWVHRHVTFSYNFARPTKTAR